MCALLFDERFFLSKLAVAASCVIIIYEQPPRIGDMAGSPINTTEQLQLENKNLKMQVEILELKLENQKLKYEEALRILKAESNLEDLIKENGKRKAVQSSEENTEIVKRKKEVKKELSEKEQKILEGLKRYVLSQIPETKFFSMYNDWFDWVLSVDVNYNETITFGDCILVKYPSLIFQITVYFTETEHFPIHNCNEFVLPMINKGWSLENTRCLLLSRSLPLLFSQQYKYNFTKEVKSSFNEKPEKPGFGSYFSFKLSKSLLIDKKTNTLVIVFVRDGTK